MAVYTRVGHDDLAPILSRLGLQLAGELEGVADGIENTTYFFTAAPGTGPGRQFVLTVLENTPQQQLAFSARFCQHLARHHLPVPAPLADSSGNYCFELKGKRALVSPRASGSHPAAITPAHCASMGDFLGRAHRCGQSFPPALDNSRGYRWAANAVTRLSKCVPAVDRDLMAGQMAEYRRLRDSSAALPRGAIHGDLFSDNALFDGEHLSAVIDFYNACTDWLLLDVAIAVNDWCTLAGNANLDKPCTEAFLLAYHRVRPFTDSERLHWQTLLCLAATRFWLSRLLARHLPDLPAENLRIKDPVVYRQRLLSRLESVPPLT